MIVNIPINRAQKIARQGIGNTKGKAMGVSKKLERQYFANDSIKGMNSANTLKNF